eukprot:CAMPEP_0172482746 /NCGR_PEP_ID=MMETSP1066-20121228/9344_1 /TAXON_ID=671091 /ORGANISM="Coscinodiscus wailesii, Strain CCMP2513" /LENGTH=38 /DNA_ID= /DNA_START= /DNA_END= /DNA_ORIENTATION=
MMKTNVEFEHETDGGENNGYINKALEKYFISHPLLYVS